MCPQPLPAAPALRASDADRAAAARHLEWALGQGMLGFEEAGERMTAAYAARYVSELAPLSSDLPPQPGPNGAWWPSHRIPGMGARPPAVDLGQWPVGVLCRRIWVTAVTTFGFVAATLLAVLLLAGAVMALHGLLWPLIR